MFDRNIFLPDVYLVTKFELHEDHDMGCDTEQSLIYLPKFCMNGLPTSIDADRDEGWRVSEEQTMGKDDDQKT
jgi:hypothetical protein